MAQEIGRELFFSADLWYNGTGDENGQRKRISEKERASTKGL